MPNPKDGGSTTPASNNLWVGNLTIDTTEADLNDLFRRYGSLDSVTSYSSRNYAFVHYKRLEDARKAKDSLQNALLRGNNIKIEFARPAKPSKNLWVGSISASVTKDQLENEFLKCGRIEEFKFLRDRNSALVEYYRLDDAVAAVKSMNGRRLGGEQIRVDFVKSSRRENLPDLHDSRDGNINNRSGGPPEPYWEAADAHKRPADGEGHVSTPQNLLPAHHLSPSQLMISSQFAELVEKANNMGYGRDFAASMIYSMEESGQPLDFNTLFGKIMRQGETSQNSFEAMMKNTGKPPVQRKPQVDLDSRLGKTQNFVTEVTAVPRDIGGRSYDTGGENHDFEPVTVPRRTLHSPSQFVVPPEVEEEVLLDSIKEIRKDGPVPSGISLREHTTPPDGRLYSIRFDSIGKPVGPNAGKFSARCGVYARMGHLFPLDVMWKNQSEASKDMALKELSEIFQSMVDLDFANSALTTIRDRLREWRYKMKMKHYEPYATDEDRIANRHPRVEEGQWKRLIALWNTEAKMVESKRNKSNKAKQVIKHTLGRQSFSVLRDKMGDVLFSVAFVEGHKKAKGGYHNKETKDLMERVTNRSQHTSSSSTTTKSCFSDIYRLQEIIQDETGKEDHGGYCRGLGSGVTRRRLSHPVGTFQTLTQAHINQMREDLNRGREDVENFKEEAKCARAEADRERMKRVAAEANAKSAIMRYNALEEVQRSTLQMFIDLQRQFNEL